MKRGERNLANIDKDYWFLRENGVRALTAIFMVGLAYKEDIVILGRPKEEHRVKTKEERNGKNGRR